MAIAVRLSASNVLRDIIGESSVAWCRRWLAETIAAARAIARDSCGGVHTELGRAVVSVYVHHTAPRLFDAATRSRVRAAARAASARASASAADPTLRRRLGRASAASRARRAQRAP